MVGLALALAGAPSVEEAVRVEAARALAVPVDDVEVLGVAMAPIAECPAGATFLAAASPGERFRGTSALWVTGLDGAQPCGRRRVSARVEVWMMAPVATMAVGPGQRVDLTLERVRRQDVDGPLIALDAGAYEAVTALAKGQPVTTLRARRVPLRRDGDRVEVAIEEGGVRVKTSCEMLEDGYEGQRVRALCSQIGSTVTGRLDGSGVVIIGGAP